MLLLAQAVELLRNELPMIVDADAEGLAPFMGMPLMAMLDGVQVEQCHDEPRKRSGQASAPQLLLELLALQGELVNLRAERVDVGAKFIRVPRKVPIDLRTCEVADNHDSRTASHQRLDLVLRLADRSVDESVDLCSCYRVLHQWVQIVPPGAFQARLTIQYELDTKHIRDVTNSKV